MSFAFRKKSWEKSLAPYPRPDQPEDTFDDGGHGEAETRGAKPRNNIYDSSYHDHPKGCPHLRPGNADSPTHTNLRINNSRHNGRA